MNFQKGICCYCERLLIGHINPTTEHLIPRSRGGLNITSNRAPACKNCNELKGSMYPEQFLNFLLIRKKKLIKMFEEKPDKSGNAEKLFMIETMIKSTKRIMDYIKKNQQSLFKNKYDLQEYLDHRSFYLGRF